MSFTFFITRWKLTGGAISCDQWGRVAYNGSSTGGARGKRQQDPAAQAAAEAASKRLLVAGSCCCLLVAACSCRYCYCCCWRAATHDFQEVHQIPYNNFSKPSYILDGRLGENAFCIDPSFVAIGDKVENQHFEWRAPVKMRFQQEETT